MPTTTPIGLRTQKPVQAVAARQQVERHGLAVQAGDLLGCGLQGEEGAIDLDAAVDQRFAGLEHEQVDEGVALGEYRGMRCL